VVVVVEEMTLELYHQVVQAEAVTVVETTLITQLQQQSILAVVEEQVVVVTNLENQAAQVLL
jgi:hypothetical protein